jgi:hypothetical protein
MNATRHVFRTILLGSALAVALALAGGRSNESGTDHMKPTSADEHQKTQTK